jgi:hypothetical protein
MNIKWQRGLLTIFIAGLKNKQVKTLTLVLRRRETPLQGLLRSLKAIHLGQVNEASGNKIRAENIPL